MPNRRPRAEFTKAVKTRAWDRCADDDGIHRCEQCTAPLAPGRIHYDHVIPAAIRPDNGLANCRVLCTACHAAKTKLDRKIIAKAHRIEERHAGVKRKRSGFKGWKNFKGEPVWADRK